MIERARALVRITELLEPLSPSDRAWVLRQYRGSTAGSTVGSPASSTEVHRQDEPGSDNGSTAGSTKGQVASEQECFFRKFWSFYPRHQSKQEARKILLKLQPDQELQDRILQAVGRQKTWEDWTKEGGRFIPLAKTWLNQKRWEDEPLKLNQVQTRNPNHSVNCDCPRCSAARTSS